jgi:hypothetical protein
MSIVNVPAVQRRRELVAIADCVVSVERPHVNDALHPCALRRPMNSSIGRVDARS